MRIGIATPAPRGSHVGNRVTALRWAGLFRQLGHPTIVCADGCGAAVCSAGCSAGGCGASGCGDHAELLVAVHATKSHAAILRWRAERGAAPVVVALAGTDLYQDLPGSPEAVRSLELADALVVLQPRALEALPPHVRHKARVILQSATPPRERSARDPGAFVVSVVAHLRPVKDPFLAAEAARLLPAASRVRVEHLGVALDVGMEARARAESASNPRWRWLGEASHDAVKRHVAASELLALTSTSEGGANALVEAIVCGTPVVSSRIDGSTGLVGDDYPGLFPVGDAPALAALLRRCEEEPAFLAELRARCAALAPLFAPERERESWRKLLAGLVS